MKFSFIDFFYLLPELYMIFTAIYILIFSIKIVFDVKSIIIGSLVYVFCYMLFIIMLIVVSTASEDYCLLSYQYLSTSFTSLLKVFLLFLLFLVIILSTGYFNIERIYFTEYYFFILILLSSSFLLMSSHDFFLFYIVLELQSLVLYTLACLKRYTNLSTEAALKYFLLGALSSGFLLFAISLFYGFTGVTNFFDFKFIFLQWTAIELSYGLNVAAAFLVSSILFKLAAAPFHIWSPDVYDGSPTPITLLFATLPKIAIFFFFFKLYFYLFKDLNFVWYHSLFMFGPLSVFWGTISALNQFNLKRLYAYSATVNIGYILSTVAFGTLSSFVVSFNYLLTYLVSTVAFFSMLLIMRRARGLHRKLKGLVSLNYYLAYSFTLSIIFSIIFFSLAGIPPLAGFFIKFFLFKTFFASEFFVHSTFFIILFTNVVSAFYYVRCIQFIFFDSSRIFELFLKFDYLVSFFLVNCSFFLIFFFFFQPIVYTFLLIHVGKFIVL